ncbi:MAG: MBL fold metallo-hydrolase [Bifidobacteriaceae bacterium]|jgi:glyoxylase-like metal-dependent hydrolase (beta-lactamase superfamily II)|nr:MBL fold metallo-hydrolase [Bifidobacteriaceae bacterium]MCI1915082.1 MBL fold metallo-hydrolase [Bifidobacteriaceae bacterium]
MYSQEVMVLGERWQTNCYLLTSLGANGQAQTLIIDPGDEPARLIKHLHDRGLTAVAAVATHAHNDHIGAMNELHDQLGVAIMIHADDQEMAANPEISGFVEEPGNEEYAVTQWDRTLHEGDEISWGSDTLQVLHTPGHTRGAICLLDAANEKLFTGDTLFAGAIGRTDFLQGDPSAMRATCRRIGGLSPRLKVFPGHGSSTSLAQEFQHNPLLMQLAEMD